MSDTIRELPSNTDAERALIGCVLLDNRIINEVAGTVSRDMFYREQHRHLWATMMELAEDGEDIDTITVSDRLEQNGKLDRVGGANVIVRLTNEVPSAASSASYARIVREMYMRRALIQDMASTQASLYDTDGATSEQAIQSLTDTCQRLTRHVVDDENPSILRHTQDWFTNIEARYNGDDTGGIPTGIEPYDDLTGGIYMQRFTSIAALPGMGKSKLGFGIVDELVREHEFVADIWYTDGAGWAIPREMAIKNAKDLSPQLLDNPKLLSEYQWAQLTRQVAEVKDLPVNIYQKGTPHIRDITLTTKARLSEIGDQPMVLLVDYCQNVTAGHTGPSAERLNITDVSRGLAALRTDHENLTVIGLMQFTKAATDRTIPKPGDLYGSSQLEKDLDHLLIFHRPAERDEESTQQEKREGVLWHAKSKHGPTGKRLMYCDLGRNVFTAMSDR